MGSHYPIIAVLTIDELYLRFVTCLVLGSVGNLVDGEIDHEHILRPYILSIF